MKKSKLVLQINPKALNDPSRALLPKGILITPPLDGDFWFYRVAVSRKQAIIGFPKFGVIGIGFQHEEDCNTNLPSGSTAEEIYEHIDHNKGDARIRPERCRTAIRMIQAAVLDTLRTETIARIGACQTDTERLAALSRFLRHTNNWKVAEAFDNNPEVKAACMQMRTL